MTLKQLNLVLDRTIARKAESGLDASWTAVETWLRAKLNRPDEGGGK